MKEIVSYSSLKNKVVIIIDYISKVVLFFVSDKSSVCTAQNYSVDGKVVN